MNYETINLFRYPAPGETVTFATHVTKLPVTDVASSKAICPEGNDEATENVGQDGRCEAEIRTPPPHPPKQRRASEAPLELTDGGSDHRKAALIILEATSGINKERT